MESRGPQTLSCWTSAGPWPVRIDRTAGDGWRAGKSSLLRVCSHSSARWGDVWSQPEGGGFRKEAASARALVSGTEK